LDRQSHDHITAIDDELSVEGPVKLAGARWILRRPKVHAIACGEAEAVLIQVIAVRNVEVRLDAFASFGDRSGEYGLLDRPGKSCESGNHKAADLAPRFHGVHFSVRVFAVRRH
jgi:hypothetical protein